MIQILVCVQKEKEKVLVGLFGNTKKTNCNQITLQILIDTLYY